MGMPLKAEKVRVRHLLSDFGWVADIWPFFIWYRFERHFCQQAPPRTGAGRRVDYEANLPYPDYSRWQPLLSSRSNRQCANWLNISH